MRFNVGDQFVEFYGGDPVGYPYTVTRLNDNGTHFYAVSHNINQEHAFMFDSFDDHLVAPCAECEGVCLTFYANEKVYKCEECGNEWD